MRDKNAAPELKNTLLRPNQACSQTTPIGLGAIVISKRNRFDRVGYKTMLRAERAENLFGLSHSCDILTARYSQMKSKICQINLFYWGGNKKAVWRQLPSCSCCLPGPNKFIFVFAGKY